MSRIEGTFVPLWGGDSGQRFESGACVTGTGTVFTNESTGDTERDGFLNNDDSDGSEGKEALLPEVARSTEACWEWQ